MRDSGQADQLPNVGDLACVVRVCGCCEASNSNLGRYVTVEEVVNPDQLICGHCLRSYPPEPMVIDDRSVAYVRSWLRKVPPLSDLESVNVHDELDVDLSREKVAA